MSDITDLTSAVNTLTAETTELLQAYIEAKENLDTNVTLATESATSAESSASTATEKATSAASSATTAAASASLASQISGLDDVAGALALSSPANIDWIVDLPLQSGKSTNKLSGALTFSRSTGCYYFDRSGLLQYADINEPVYVKDGYYSHGAFTNKMTYSEFNGDGAYAPVGTTGIWSGFTTINNIGMMGVKYDETSTLKDVTLSTAGNSFHASCVVSSIGTASYCRVRYVATGGSSSRAIDLKFNWSNGLLLSVDTTEMGSGWSFKYTKLSSGLYRVQCRYNATIESLGHTIARTIVYSGSSTLTAYYGAFQLLEGLYPVDVLYSRTTIAEATVASASMLIPMTGNMPPHNSDYTMVFDIVLFDTTSAMQNFLTLPTGISGGSWLCRAYLGNVQFYMDNYDSTDSAVSISYNSISTARVCCRLSDGYISVSLNGTIVKQSTPIQNRVPPVFTSGMRINGGSIATYGSIMKNFKIIDKALTDDQIKALGAS